MTDPPRNNAEWCDAVCRSHGIPTAFGADFWSAAKRTPKFYPDAVTLTRDADPAAILRSVDNSVGCSVKDSFACLDLTPYGFTVLFDAEWIVRPAGNSIESPQWTPIRTADELARWERGFGSTGLFLPPLLADERIAIFANYEGDRVVGGCVTNTTGSMVGLSNVFGDYAGAVATVAGQFPGRPIVGYERGSDLDTAAALGFTTAGPLRIWAR